MGLGVGVKYRQACWNGCGCKISPGVLDKILKTDVEFKDENLLVGNETKDDAAVYNVGGHGIVSTTDFFMPIVDDPHDFGRVAATNALSDIYAMGGKPIMAISILGWPLSKLDASVAQKVVDGGRSACKDAGVSLCGGHSIDAPEPIFGLAVTGVVDPSQLKQNSTAKSGCVLLLSKPLGIGILTTAEKKEKLQPADVGAATKVMCTLNSVGIDLAKMAEITALTDVTGFGLGGHLLEMCEGSNLRADLWFDSLPVLPNVAHYVKEGCVPGGTQRNFESYGAKISTMTDDQKSIICDPQTSGGLLMAVLPEKVEEVAQLLKEKLPQFPKPTAIGIFAPQESGKPFLSVLDNKV
eukprot:CAMPEP_0113846260 /NCGR_PEP_ID=MMETSP0372-20130328/1210_1 /TAXON_ID=340204 /ORGANISM="Lankesteria abbotti" /LENGTH=352 /DNA_ID=CAMNT_0000815387 /DNA_START=82 /DNA_END=1140 /DNA_ORIENTATION=+ /assembly_acc=CAM_ASM_000359